MFSEPFDYEGTLASARAPEGQVSGALRECVDSWQGNLAAARKRVFDYLGQRRLTRDAVVVLRETGVVADHSDYAYLLLVNGIAIRGLLTGRPVEEDVSGSDAARRIRAMTHGELEALSSDERSDPDIDHGWCALVTVVKEGRMYQFGHYAAFRKYQTPEEKLLKLLEPLSSRKDIEYGAPAPYISP